MSNINQFADAIYEAVCRDTEEKPTVKGTQAFRDRVFEGCTEKVVSLSGCRMGSHACVALMKLLKNGSVKRVDLSNNNIQDFGIASIVQGIKTVPSLRFINLQSNGITNEGALSLAKLLAVNSSVLQLDLGVSSGDLRKNVIEAKGASQLAVSLTTNRSLTSLSLASNPIGKGVAKAADTIAAMLGRNNTLTHLDLTDTQLGTRGAGVICASLLQNRAIRYLHLGNNNIGQDISRTLEQVLHGANTLISLTLEGNPIGRGSITILEALRSNQSIVNLNLDNTDLGDEGAEALSNVLVNNSTLTNISIANNGIGEIGGQALAYAFSRNQVLNSLNLSQNTLKNSSVIAIAEALVTNQSFLSIDLSSCKIGDDGAVALVSAVGHNENILLRKLRLRDNYISAQAGDLMVDALYRNKSLTVTDLRGNQIDHVRLNKIRSICKRNLMEIKDAEPRRLRKEISRLKGEQVKLRKAEKTLRSYQQSIEQTKKKIGNIEAEKMEFLQNQQKRRNDIQAQIDKEKESIREAQEKLEEKKKELNSVEKVYNSRIEELQRTLAKEAESRKGIESELAAIKSELEQTVHDRPSKVKELKERIETVRSEKLQYQKQLTSVRKELSRLQQAYREGQPILDLIDQARELLMQNGLEVEEEQAAAEDPKKDALLGKASKDASRNSRRKSSRASKRSTKS